MKSFLIIVSALCLNNFVNGQAGDLASLVKDKFKNRGTTPIPISPSNQNVSPQSGKSDELDDKLINDLFGVTTKEPNKVIDLQPVENHNGIPGTGNCVCVPYYLCKDGSVNTNGEGVIDIRIKEGTCAANIDICCNHENTVTEPITPPPKTVKSGCGFRNTQGAGFRIIGGADEAQFGEFPWMVAIIREESVNSNPVKLNVYQCGGALINLQVVLTAAHCVAQKTKSYKIRAGEWDTQHEKELLPFQDREIESMVIHPNYYAGALHNDIALLFLKSPFDPAEHIATVCLPPQNQALDSGRGFATGWGKDQFGKKGSYQVILKKIDLPIVPTNICQEKLRTTRLGMYFNLHESFLCAGGEPGKDTCKGDGGSPFVIPTGTEVDKYYQAGIVAWGIGCGENSIPGVYVNVAKFRSWIDTQMTKRRFDTSSYTY